MELIQYAIDNTNLAMVLIYLALWLGFIAFLFSVSKAFVSNSWPVVSGRVTQSKVRERQRISKSGGKQILYELDFKYDYAVASKNYSGSRYRFFDVFTNSKTFPQSVAQSHPTGSNIDVHYKPSNPATSVIQRGVSGGVYLFILFFLLSIGSMSAVFYQKMS